MTRMVVGLVLIANVVFALPPKDGERYVAAARSLVGVRYEFGGRMKTAANGIDCLGLFFFAFEVVSGCGWKSYSVFPSEAVKRGEYGSPVIGLSPAPSATLDVSQLRAGDIVLLASGVENVAEASVSQLDGMPLWVWHTGMYAGDGKWIVGDHFAGRVIEIDLKAYLAEHESTYPAVFVMRMESRPNPKVCRKHAPMRRW